MLKSLLYVLVGFSHCDAVRQKMGQTTSAAHVIGEITSMLDQRGYSMKALTSLQQVAGGETPTAFDTIIAAVVADLETNVEATIRAQFNSSQAALAASIETLRTRTTTALAAKSTADAADNSWFACVEEEKGRLAAQETAADSLAEANSSAITLCAEMDKQGSTPFTTQLTLGGFSCDLSQMGSCTEALNNYNHQLDTMISEMQGDLQEVKDSYNQAKAACVSANTYLDDQAIAHSNATQDFNSQQLQCLTMHETRQTAMCMFGSDLQVKCAAEDDFKDLVGEVEAANGGLQAEWNTVSVAKCLLQAVQGGSELSSETLSACESGVDYQSDVGTLDMFTSTFESLAHADSVNCGGATITFSGRTMNTGVNSTDYHVVDYHPALDISNPAAPFNFCCPAPVNPVLEQVGKWCPVWYDGSTCLNNAFTYRSLEAAWAACGQNTECDLISYQEDRNKWTIHRDSDPDDSRWESIRFECTIR